MKDLNTVTINDLEVYLGDKLVITLNPKFIESRNCWGNLDLIKELFLTKAMIFQEMRKNPKKTYPEYDQELTDLEYKIQEAYKFPRDAKFHRFWERPGCKCPHMDNSEFFGTDFNIYMGDCPLHGHNVKNR